MSDFTKIKTQIQSLIDSANATTGNTDDNLTDGVNALITGYGSDGIDTSSDNPATADDMAKDKEAFVNGEKVTGNIGYPPNVVFESPKIYKTNTGASNFPIIYLTYGEKDTDKKYIVGKGNPIKIYTKLENFGDAIAEDVVEGKIFTSADGLAKVGTHKCSSGYSTGDIVKAYQSENVTVGSGYSNITIQYGSEVVATDGTLSLGGTTGSVSVSSVDSLETVKGKYIKISTSSMGSSSSGGIYYIPPDATFTQGGSTYSKTYTVDKANQMFVLG